MRTLIICSFFYLFTIICCSGQQKIFTFPVPFHDALDVKAIAAKDGSVCYVFSSGQRHYFYTVPAKKDTFYSAVLVQSYDNKVPEIITSLNASEHFVFYYFDPLFTSRLNAFIVNKQDGTVRIEKDIEYTAPGKGRLVKILSDNNAVYFIYHYKKKQQVGLRRFTDFNESGFKLFDSNMPETGKAFKTAEFKKINLNLPNTIYQAHFTEKVYVKNNDQLVFSFDISAENDKCRTGAFGSTRLLFLDWNTGESVYRKVDSDLSDHHYKSNSFLFNDVLLRLSLKEKEFNLSMLNTSNNSVLKQYHYVKNDSITIQSTDLTIEGARTFFEKEKSYLDEERKIFRKLNDGFPAISVYPSGDSLLMASVGSYQPPVDNRYSFMVAFISPILLAIPSPGVFSTGKGSAIYFKSCFNRNTMDYVCRFSEPNILDRIFDYLYEKKDEKIGETITYSFADQIHLGYIDKKNKTFNIVAF